MYSTFTIIFILLFLFFYFFLIQQKIVYDRDLRPQVG